jgi:hypothetical protein
MESTALINQPISVLGLSKGFLQASKEMGFETIAGVLATDPAELVTKDGFNYNWLGELVRFLTKHELLDLLQPLPGKTHG